MAEYFLLGNVMLLWENISISSTPLVIKNMPHWIYHFCAHFYHKLRFDCPETHDRSNHGNSLNTKGGPRPGQQRLGFSSGWLGYIGLMISVSTRDLQCASELTHKSPSKHWYTSTPFSSVAFSSTICLWSSNQTIGAGHESSYRQQCIRLELLCVYRDHLWLPCDSTGGQNRL